MNKEEYLAMRANIFELLAKLDDQYGRSIHCIEPGTIVIAAGQKCYLNRYKVVSGDVYPVLLKLRPDNTPSHRIIYVSKNAKIVKA